MSAADAFAESQQNASDAAGAALRNARKAPRKSGKGVVRTGPAKGWLPDQFPGMPGGDTGTGGDGGSADQALIDALEASTRATEEHTAALRGVEGELKRQTDLANSAMATDQFQLYKFVADVMSGQLGRGIVNRGMTPGGGVEVAY